MNVYQCVDKAGGPYQIQTNQTQDGWTVDIMFDVKLENHLQNFHCYSEDYYSSEEAAIEVGQKIYANERGKIK